MFDQNDQNQQATTTAPMPSASSGAPQLPADPSAPSTPAVNDMAAPTNDQPFNMTPLSTTDSPVPASDPTTAPANDSMFGNSTPSLPATDSTAVASASNDDSSFSGIPDLSTPSTPVSTAAPAGDDDLLNIKKDALQSLSPLLGKLEQSPEEKFRTTMMLIQASDDQSLIQTAYAAAKEISDEKVRAQALLDIVNEINYFTQAKSASNQL